MFRTSNYLFLKKNNKNYYINNYIIIMGKISVVLHSAEGLICKDSDGKNDCFVVGELGLEEKKSTIRLNSVLFKLNKF